MRRRFVWGLLGLLLLPLVGIFRLFLVILHFIVRQPQVVFLFAVVGFVLAIGHPTGELPEERIRLLERAMWSWGTLVVVILIVAYGATSREMKRLWRWLR